MTKVSRRAIIAAGLALPTVGAAQATSSLTASKKASLDPLVTLAGDWIALRARVDALSVEADDLQGRVFAEARTLGMKSERACGSSLAKAAAWRAKKLEFEDGSRQLERMASKIEKMRAVTADGAIAKIELALHVQYEEWSEYAFEFVEDGIADLRELIAGAAEHC